MSNKVALWAFDDTVPQEEIRAAFRNGIDIVAIDMKIGQAYVTLKEIDGVTFAQLFATDRQQSSGIARGAILDSLPYGPPVAFLGHDDQLGIELFDGQGEGRVFLVSDGHQLGGTLDKVTVEYPQRGFTHEELDAIAGRPGAELTDREAAAVRDYRGAIAVGLEQMFGWRSGVAYLDVCYEQQGYHIWSGELVDLPADAQPLVAYWPEDRDHYRADVPPRPW